MWFPGEQRRHHPVWKCLFVIEDPGVRARAQLSLAMGNDWGLDLAQTWRLGEQNCWRNPGHINPEELVLLGQPNTHRHVKVRIIEIFPVRPSSLYVRLPNYIVQEITRVWSTMPIFNACPSKHCICRECWAFERKLSSTVGKHRSWSFTTTGNTLEKRLASRLSIARVVLSCKSFATEDILSFSNRTEPNLT